MNQNQKMQEKRTYEPTPEVKKIEMDECEKK